MGGHHSPNLTDTQNPAYGLASGRGANPNVSATLDIDADIPNGAPDHVVRTVTENGRTLEFTSQGFEQE